MLHFQLIENMQNYAFKSSQRKIIIQNYLNNIEQISTTKSLVT